MVFPAVHRRGHLQVRDVLAPRPDVLPQVLLLPAAVALLRRGDAPRRQGEGGLLSDIRLLHGGPRPRRRNLRASTCFAGSSSARPRREPPRSAGASLDARSTGLCFQQPPVFQTIYLKTPTTCLSNDGICCCILHGDCAIPCDEGVPVACTLFYTGLLLYPKVRAARVVFEGRPWPARFNSGVATRNVRGRVAAPPRTSRGDAAAATWIFRGDESQRRRRSDVNSPNAGRVLHQGRRRVHRQRAACANPAPGRYASLPRRRRESPALRAVARRDPRPRLAAPRSSTARRASATSSRNMYSRSSPSRRSRAARRRTWREETHARRRRSGADESSAHEDARRDPRT